MGFFDTYLSSDYVLPSIYWNVLFKATGSDSGGCVCMGEHCLELYNRAATITRVVTLQKMYPLILIINGSFINYKDQTFAA